MARHLRIFGVDVSSITIEPSTGKVDCSRVPGIGGLDFPTPAELCRCCGIVLLASGSRWSVWFCEACKERVIALNRKLGAWVFPIGRHTVMHGVLLPVAEAVDEAKREAFVAAAKGLFGQMRRLGEWADEIVRRNCRATGLDELERVTIRRYLRAVRDLPREAAFEAMCEWWVQ